MCAAFVGCSLPFERHHLRGAYSTISVVELKKALNEESIPLDGIDSQRLGIEESIILESIPSPNFY